MGDGTAKALEVGDGISGSVRSERRAKSFVGALVLVDCRYERRLRRVVWGDRHTGVIGPGGVKRDRPCRDFGRQAIEPAFRNEIEKCRGGDQVNRTIKRGL